MDGDTSAARFGRMQSPRARPDTPEQWVDLARSHLAPGMVFTSLFTARIHTRSDGPAECMSAQILLRRCCYSTGSSRTDRGAAHGAARRAAPVGPFPGKVKICLFATMPAAIQLVRVGQRIPSPPAGFVQLVSIQPQIFLNITA